MSLSRRAFLKLSVQMTAVLAAGVDLGYAESVAIPPPTAATVDLATGGWIPTTAEVGNWLTWYKAWVSGQFPNVQELFPEESYVVRWQKGRIEDDDFVTGEQTLWRPVDQHPEDMIIGVREFETAMAKLESTRVDVGWAQGSGYEAGRRGDSRESRSYHGPCNEGFAWYNGWAQGNLDYRRRIGQLEAHERPERNRGVTWPVGHRLHKPVKRI
jgi:hypothetical protein